MRTSGWFAAGIASFGVTVAGAADGLDVPASHSPFALQRAAPAELPSAPRASLPALAREGAAGNAFRIDRGDGLARPVCRPQDVCHDVVEGRILYRGARRYMPSWQGMDAEGISLKHDRLILRYSFR